MSLTGYGLDVDRARSAAAGINEHLVKPATLETILAALRGDPTPPREVRL